MGPKVTGLKVMGPKVVSPMVGGHAFDLRPSDVLTSRPSNLPTFDALTFACPVRYNDPELN